MEKINTIVKSNIPPRDTNVVWLNTEDGSINVFDPQEGWKTLTSSSAILDVEELPEASENVDKIVRYDGELYVVQEESSSYDWVPLSAKYYAGDNIAIDSENTISAKGYSWGGTTGSKAGTFVTKPSSGENTAGRNGFACGDNTSSAMFGFSYGSGATATGTGAAAGGISTLAYGTFSLSEVRGLKTNLGTVTEVPSTSPYKIKIGNSVSQYTFNGTTYKIVEGDTISNQRGVVATITKTEDAAGPLYYVLSTGPFSLGDTVYIHLGNALGDSSVAQGNGAIAQGRAANATGTVTRAIGENSHAEGKLTVAQGTSSHAEGEAGERDYLAFRFSMTANSTEISPSAYGFGNVVVNDILGYTENGVTRYARVTEIGEMPSGKIHLTNTLTTLGFSGTNRVFRLKGGAIGDASHTEGYGTIAMNSHAHAEGRSTKALGNVAHAEGWGTIASGYSSHVEGEYTEANNVAEHAEGMFNKSNTNVGMEFVDLGLPSGKLWAKCDVGAESEEIYGTEFAWGEVETKTSFSWNNYKFGSSSPFSKYDADSKTVLEAEDDAARVIVGAKVIMPTKDDFDELIANTDFSAETIAGKSGYKFTSRSDASKYVFFPRKPSDSHNQSMHWTSSLNTNSHDSAYYAVMYVWNGSTGKQTSTTPRCYGNPIRPILAPGQVAGSKTSTRSSIGIGNDPTSRKNAIEVMANGDIYIYGVGGYDGTNAGSASTLQDLLSNL